MNCPKLELSDADTCLLQDYFYMKETEKNTKAYLRFYLHRLQQGISMNKREIAEIKNYVTRSIIYRSNFKARQILSDALIIFTMSDSEERNVSIETAFESLRNDIPF